MAKWETFRDSSNFDLHAVRPVGEDKFGNAFHLLKENDAIVLADLLSKYDVPNPFNDEIHYSDFEIGDIVQCISEEHGIFGVGQYYTTVEGYDGRPAIPVDDLLYLGNSAKWELVRRHGKKT